jgi:hypothetical protein
MVDDKTIRDCLANEEQGNAMGASGHPAKGDLAISIFVLVTDPDVTVAILDPF